MTAQEKGLAMLVTAARAIVPPQLDFVIILFEPKGGQKDIEITSAMYPSDKLTPIQQYERAKEAAQAFITHKPHASFNPNN